MYFFGFFSTLILFIIFNSLKNRIFFKKIPIILSVGVSIIVLLKVFHIDYQTYYKSANVFSFMIAPSTIALGYLLYKNSNILLKNKRALYPAFFLALFVAVVSTYFCAKILNAKHEIIMSLIPKSTTMPIALEISKSIGGYCELTACVVVITGVFGGLFGHFILKKLNIKSNIAIGLAIGSASHVIGTAACVEKHKEKQACASAIALVAVGILSAVLIPVFKSRF